MRPCLSALLLVAALCAPAAAQNNVLVVVLDDAGVDLIGAYGEHPEPANTPVIDGLAANGVLFRNAWALPNCSASRASILTGTLGFRHGIGRGINYITDAYELYPGTTTLPQLLAPTYHTIALGKWHLATGAPQNTDHPNLIGFEDFRGNMQGFPKAVDDGTGHIGHAVTGTPNVPAHLSGGPGSAQTPQAPTGTTGPPKIQLFQDTYFAFQKVENGVTSLSLTYSTTDIVNDAIELVSGTTEPWFLWMAFNAPKKPYHKPPGHLHTQTLPPEVLDDLPMHGRAMLEAVDTELGRFLGELPPKVRANTLIVVLGDNGTQSSMTTPPFEGLKAKETVYEGGVNVPLIISGPGVVDGGECAALVHVTDLFRTIAERTGVSADSGLDSVSLAPYLDQPGAPTVRTWVYTEQFKPNGYGPHALSHRAARDDRFKLIRGFGGTSLPAPTQFFDLANDPFETADLLQGTLEPDAEASFNALTSLLDSLIPTWLDVGHALGGVLGLPSLKGEGTPTSAGTVSVLLSRARPEGAVTLFASPTTVNAKYLGGVIIPSLGSAVTGLVAEPDGTLTITLPLPKVLPPGTKMYFQAWIVDEAAPQGWSASNALVATAS